MPQQSVHCLVDRKGGRDANPSQKRLVMLSCVMSISPWVTSLSYAADRLVEGVMVVAPGDALGIAASGAVEDTLKACMARIPAEATVQGSACWPNKAA